MQHHSPLIEEIEAFLSSSGMGEAYFGRLAARNTELVKRLRAGGRVWPETEDSVRSFIASHSPTAPSSEGSQPGGVLPSDKRLGASTPAQGTENLTFGGAE